MTTRSIAKVILLTLDEVDLIEDFLAYYSALFDARNVHVVDNGSVSPSVLSAYDAHRRAGGTVVVDTRNFKVANEFMTEHMLALAPSCEFILPLETDEFLFLRTDQKVSNEISLPQFRSAVLEHMASIPKGIGLLRYGAFWGSCVDTADPGYERGSYTRPALSMTRFYDQGWDKLIVRSSSFLKMSQWCHHAEIADGFVVGKSSLLGLLHFHDTGLKRCVERSRPVVASYGYLDVRQQRLPTSEQLEITSKLRGLPLSCGHKVEYLDRHLRREETVKAFVRHLGRLPVSYAEMNSVAESQDVLRGGGGSPDSYVRRELAAGRMSKRTTDNEVVSICSSGWEDLVYHEPRKEHEFVVHQVSSILSRLDIGNRNLVLSESVREIRSSTAKILIVPDPGFGPSSTQSLVDTFSDAMDALVANVDVKDATIDVAARTNNEAETASRALDGERARRRDRNGGGERGDLTLKVRSFKAPLGDAKNDTDVLEAIKRMPDGKMDHDVFHTLIPFLNKSSWVLKGRPKSSSHSHSHSHHT
jgi:hypothetical protein